VPGFAGGGIVPHHKIIGGNYRHPRIIGGNYRHPGLTPMELVIEQWAREIWRDDLRHYGRRGPIGLTEMEHLFGATRPHRSGMWTNPQYRFLEKYMAEDMRSYYLKDTMYWALRGKEGALNRGEASQLAFYRHRALEDLRASERHGLSAHEREFYRYWAKINLEDASKLRTEDHRKMLKLQEEAQALFKSMGYARGGLIPFGHYDQGGMLPPGLSMALNTTGRPEPVGGSSQVMHVHLEIGGREIANAMVPYMVGSVNRYGIRNSGRATGILRPS
jgi:hypothetical protein